MDLFSKVRGLERWELASGHRFLSTTEDKYVLCEHCMQGSTIEFIRSQQKLSLCPKTYARVITGNELRHRPFVLVTVTEYGFSRQPHRSGAPSPEAMGPRAIADCGARPHPKGAGAG